MACQPNSTATVVLDAIKENYDNYLLIDAGSNMVNKKFSRDLESVLQRAKDSGVPHDVYLCVDVLSNKKKIKPVAACWV